MQKVELGQQAKRSRAAVDSDSGSSNSAELAHYMPPRHLEKYTQELT